MLLFGKGAFFMFKFSTKTLARAGVIAGLYVILSLSFFTIASGPVQMRVSEGLTLLPLLFPEAVPAVFVGCMLSNLITGCAVFDIIFGSLITLIAAVLTYFTGKLFKKHALKIAVGGIFPIVLNAVFLPVIWYFCYGELEYLYIIQVLILLAGQSAAVYVFGSVFYFATLKLNGKVALFNEKTDKGKPEENDCQTK